jgi:hypothetical protein
MLGFGPSSYAAIIGHPPVFFFPYAQFGPYDRAMRPGGFFGVAVFHISRRGWEQSLNEFKM